VKLLFFTGRFGGGGAERRIVLLANYFIVEGYQVAIIAFKKEGNYLEFLNKSVSIFELKKHKYFTQTSRILQTRYVYKSFAPDIIFSNLAGTNKISIYTNAMFLNKYKTIIGIVNNPIAYSKQLFLKILYRLPEKVIANSKGLQKAIIDVWNLKPDRVACIHNGLDIEKITELAAKSIKPSIVKNHNNYPQICAIGSLTQQKGYDTLLKAIQIVLLKRKIFLIIIGVGKLGLQLKNMVKELRIEDYVQFLGYKANPYKYINNSDLFVHASNYEGFPNVIIEAMICNKPVIATKASFGPEELIEEGETGFLIPVGDYKRLADRIITIIDRNCVVIEMRLKARENVSKKFNKSIMCNRYEKLFRHIKSR